MVIKAGFILNRKGIGDSMRSSPIPNLDLPSAIISVFPFIGDGLQRSATHLYHYPF